MGGLGLFEPIKLKAATSQGDAACWHLFGDPEVTDGLYGYILQVEAIAGQKDIDFVFPILLISRKYIMKGKSTFTDIYDLPQLCTLGPQDCKCPLFGAKPD